MLASKGPTEWKIGHNPPGSEKMTQSLFEVIGNTPLLEIRFAYKKSIRTI
jgi:hypothetical protein